MVYCGLHGVIVTLVLYVVIRVNTDVSEVHLAVFWCPLSRPDTFTLELSWWVIIAWVIRQDYAGLLTDITVFTIMT